MLNFQIFTNSKAKSNFFDGFSINLNVYTYKRLFLFTLGLNYQKLKILAKILPKNENFGNFTKIGTFSKNNIEK